MNNISKNLFKLSFYNASIYNITRNVKEIYAEYKEISNKNIFIELIFIFFEEPSSFDKQYSYDIASTVIGDFSEINDINVKFYTYKDYIEKKNFIVLFSLAEE